MTNLNLELENDKKRSKEIKNEINNKRNSLDQNNTIELDKFNKLVNQYNDYSSSYNEKINSFNKLINRINQINSSNYIK